MKKSQAWLFYTIGFCIVCGNSAMVMFLSLFFKRKGISEEMIGGLLGIYNIMLPIVILILGLVSDRMSCKKLVLFGCLIFMLYSLIMPTLDSVYLIGMAKIIGGIGITLSFIPLNILFLKILDGKNKGKRLALFVSIMTIGYAVGSSLSSLAISQYKLPVVSIFYLAFPFIFTAFVLSFKLPEAPIEKFPLIKYFHDMNQAPVFCIAIISFAVGIHWGSENFVTVRFLSDYLKTSGYLMAFYFISTAMAMYYFSNKAGKLMDRKGNFLNMLIWGIIASGAFHAVTKYATTFTEFYIAQVLHTCGDGIVIFFVPMLIKMVFSSSRIGGNFGFNRTVTALGSTSGVVLSGYIVQRYFIGDPFFVTGIIQVFSGIVILLLKNHIPVHKAEIITPTAIPENAECCK